MSRGLEGQTRCGELKAELIAHGQHTVQRLLDISPQMWECLTVIAARQARREEARRGGGLLLPTRPLFLPCHEAVSLHVGLACVLLGSKSATCFVCAHWALRAARPEHVRAARREHAVRVRPRKLGW